MQIYNVEFLFSIVFLFPCMLNQNLNSVARTYGLLGLDRIVVATFRVSGIVVEVATADIVCLLGMDFTTATDLCRRIVDDIATI